MTKKRKPIINLDKCEVEFQSREKPYPILNKFKCKPSPEYSRRRPIADENFPEFAVELADSFSAIFKKLGEGDYETHGGSVVIRFHSLVPTIRVNQKSKRIEIPASQRYNPKYTRDFIFFFILWCYIRPDCSSDSDADLKVLPFYLAQGRSKRELAIGALNIFVKNQFNEERYQKNLDAINEFDASPTILPTIAIWGE